MNSRTLLREQLVLKDIFDIIYGVNGFVCGENIIVNDINENFYDNGYYYPTPYPIPALAF